MKSAFGIEHGEVSKGLPSAVRAGGGGYYGMLMRDAKAGGKLAGARRTFNHQSGQLGSNFKQAMRQQGRDIQRSNVLARGGGKPRLP